LKDRLQQELDGQLFGCRWQVWVETVRWTKT